MFELGKVLVNEPNHGLDDQSPCRVGGLIFKIVSRGDSSEKMTSFPRMKNSTPNNSRSDPASPLGPARRSCDRATPMRRHFLLPCVGLVGGRMISIDGT